jgi:hypothetical protein
MIPWGRSGGSDPRVLKERCAQPAPEVHPKKERTTPKVAVLAMWMIGGVVALAAILLLLLPEPVVNFLVLWLWLFFSR